MTGLDDRKDAIEAKYAHDEQLDFQTEARCCKLFGLVIAEKIGLSGDEAEKYAMDVVSANLEEPGFEDVFRKVRPDLDAKNIEYTQNWLETTIAESLAEARKQLAEG